MNRLMMLALATLLVAGCATKRADTKIFIYEADEHCTTKKITEVILYRGTHWAFAEDGSGTPIRDWYAARKLMLADKRYVCAQMWLYDPFGVPPRPEGDQ